jgi:SAM-dependent methyltransferase
LINSYSNEWFSFFLQPIQSEQTEFEIDFVARNLPQPGYQTVVDLCCGAGRHCNLLALRNYEVIGIDNNVTALEQARKGSNGSVTYVAKDMRNFSEIPGKFDAVLNLWQSFGYFDEKTNQNILRQIAEKLNSKGRFILDIYHRDFFSNNQGKRQFEKDGISITETKLMIGNRLTVTLVYDTLNKTDRFDWQLYTPKEIIELLKSSGLEYALACTGFDEKQIPSENSPRVQYVFEKVV